MSPLPTSGRSADDAAPFDWRKYLPVHPAAELFPLMKETDPAGFKELVSDIEANGLRTPIVLFGACGDEDCLIDSRNRAAALASLGLLGLNDGRLVWKDRRPHDCWDLFCRTGRNHDPYALAISLNIRRRHLTPAGKDDLLAAVLKVKSELSNRQIGEITKTDKKKVQAVRAKLEATGEITPVEKTVGKDKKARKKPARKAKPAAPAIKGDTEKVEHDRKACIALYKKIEDANRERAQWLVDYPQYSGAAPGGTQRAATKPPDEAAAEQFDAHILELVRRTKGAKPQSFLKTAVPTRDLYKLAVFLTEIVALKKLSGSEDESRLIPAGNGVSADASADQMKAKHAALDERPASEAAE